MKDSDTQKIYESWLAGGMTTLQNDPPVIEEQPPAPAAPAPGHTPPAPGPGGSGASDPTIVALQAALKKNPGLAQAVLALPEIAAAAGGGGAPAPAPAPGGPPKVVQPMPQPVRPAPAA